MPGVILACKHVADHAGLTVGLDALARARVTQYWVADDEPNERFTLYTRGNVGEVFPHVMTALTGTLIGDAVQRGQTELLVEMGVLRPHEIVGPSVGTGVFGGYLYMNGSAMRLFGVRMPGMSARDADEQVMGEVTDLPPYRPGEGRPQPASPRWR